MEKDKIELRSEKVQHIICENPSWIVRYGITIICLIIFGIISIAYLIYFMETNKVKIDIDTLLSVFHIN